MTKLVSFIYIIVFISSMILVSCRNSSETTILEAPVETGNSIYGSKISAIPALSEKTKEQCIQWPLFEDFELEARSLKGNTLDKLRYKSEQLVNYTDSLAKKIPDTLNINAISSRLTIVRTRANLLFQEAGKKRVDSVEVENAITEMNLAVINFILQLNEKFDKDEIDLQRREDEKKELKKQKRFLDSVYNAEIQDKKSR